MKLRRLFIVMLPFVHVAVVTCATRNRDAAFETFGEKSVKTATQTAINQSKRDISLSYSATDIDSKEGARFKTITVIKNLNKDGTSEKLTINPELYKNENWANTFRDNFDSYGTIPDVPDIDDLFEFMNKKSKIKPKSTKIENKTEKSSSSSSMTSTLRSVLPSRTPYKGIMEENEKPVVEPTIESFEEEKATMNVEPDLTMTMTMTNVTSYNKNFTSESNKNKQKSSPTIEKITGDAELIPTSGVIGQKRQSSKNDNSNSASSSRTQSILLSKEKLREQLINVNYSTPKHSVHQYFENYIQENKKGYDYSQPCINLPLSSVTVTTPSGRTYDIPRTSSAAGNKNGIINPYIAPSVAKKSPQQQSIPAIQINPSQRFPPYNQQPPTYSVNSIVPPLQQTSNYVGPALVPTYSTRQPTTVQKSTGNQQSQYPNGLSTSQRPYVAPNLRNGLGYSRAPSTTPSYNSATGLPNYRTNIYGINKLNIGRSRGLKY